jgi:nitrate reductase cytochrome c-type subunit
VNVETVVAELDAQLTAFGAEYDSLDFRGKVLRLTDILKATRKLNVATLKAEGITARGGRERLRVYMTRYVGVALDAIELEVVGGISEYGRRIRELRVQDGYKIVSGPLDPEETGLNLRRNQYMLLRIEPDLTAAHRWHIANRIRRESGSAQDRMLHFLQENVGQVVTTEELAYVGKAIAYARRVRELRTEQGYAVATKLTGRPDLRPGEYVLEAVDRVDQPHDRHIPREVEEEVYRRDNNTCVNCGWDRSRWTREDPRFLQIHHVIQHAKRGSDTPENLVVLCNRCHVDVHSGRIIVHPPRP